LSSSLSGNIPSLTGRGEAAIKIKTSKMWNAVLNFESGISITPKLFYDLYVNINLQDV